MLGELNEQQMEEILKRQVTGRIGCHTHDTTYIVPINYVYKNGTIYAHSGPGKKIDMMRQSPSVCFEVDEIDSIFHWRSVIGWGKFEEITDQDEREQVMQGIIHRIMPFVSAPSGHPYHGITEKENDIGSKLDLIIYKVKLIKLTGRFEKP